MEQQTVDGPKAKARQVLGGARELFLELGYEGTSVDEIARRAKVSKPTVYAHFGDKRGLFTAFVRSECEEQGRRIFVIAHEPGAVGDTLQSIARHYLNFLLSPFAQGIFRLVIAESPRFPELGRAFYESGPQLGVSRLAVLLEAASRSGELAVSEPHEAARSFIELCKADLFYPTMFGVLKKPTRAEINRSADRAAATFVRAYVPDRVSRRASL